MKIIVDNQVTVAEIGFIAQMADCMLERIGNTGNYRLVPKRSRSNPPASKPQRPSNVLPFRR